MRLGNYKSKQLRLMKRPIEVLQYVDTPSQARGYSAFDLGQNLVRQSGVKNQEIYGKI